MSHAKRMLDEGPAIHANERFVCAGCFVDEALRALIAANSVKESCEFCDGEGTEPVAPLRVVIDRIEQGISIEHSDAANHLPYCGAEGGYFGDHYDTYDLLANKLELELPRDAGDLLRALVERLPDLAWCSKRPNEMPESFRLISSWKEFCQLVKHERRYFFFEHEYPEGPADGSYDPDAPLSPRQILERVTALAEEKGLVAELPSGTVLYRAREHKKGTDPLRTAAQLGPPPPQYAAANRMSAAGVPVMYAGSELETAIAETKCPSGQMTVGTFIASRELRILDLSAVPFVPSLFDIPAAYSRQAISFLRRFAEDVSRPLGEDSAVHVEYVPTQIVTEFVRFHFRPRGNPVDGIKYKSPQNEGGTCIALFATQENVADEGAAPTSPDVVAYLRSTSDHTVPGSDPR